MKEKFSFYLTEKSSKHLEEIQKDILEQRGRVTKAYIVNTAINEYHEKLSKENIDK